MKFPTKVSNVIYSSEKGLIYNLSTNKCYSASEDLFYMLNLMDGKHTVEEIFNRISRGYSVSLEGLNKILHSMSDCGIIALLNSADEKYEENLKESIRVVSIELTDRCNLKCIYCYGSFDPTNHTALSLKEVRALFNELSNRGVRVIELTGGEPTMNKKFNEIFLEACERFHHVNIMTNAVHFKESTYNLFKQYSSKVGFSISVDGFSEQSNCIQRGMPNTFQKTIDNIVRIKETIDPSYFRIVYMLTNNNVLEVEEFCRFMLSKRINNIIFSIPENITRGRSYNLPDGKDMSDRTSMSRKELENKIVELYEIFKGKIETPTEKLGEKGMTFFNVIPSCGAGWNMLSIKSNGDVVPCNFMDDKFIMGNVKIDPRLNFLSRSNKLYDLFTKLDLGMTDGKRDECYGCEDALYCGKCIHRIIVANKKRLSRGEELCPIVTKNHMMNLFK